MEDKNGLSAEEIENDVMIDPDQLDEEWLNQPGLVIKYSELITDATEHRDTMKDLLTFEMADLAEKIRSSEDPKKDFGVSKTTVDAISGGVERNEKIIQLRKGLIKANGDVNRLQGISKAIDHRKAALTDLVRLVLGEYFAAPTEPRQLPGGKRSVQKVRQEQTTRTQRESLNTHRRRN